MTDEQSLQAAPVELLPGVFPRKYQEECLHILEQERQFGEQRALIHMATGLGKTTIIALVLDRFLTEQPEARILFLCHRIEILEQARGVLEEKLVSHHKTFSTFDTSDLSAEALGADIMFASFQTMHRGNEEEGRWRSIFNPHDFDYVIVGDSEHAAAAN